LQMASKTVTTAQGLYATTSFLLPAMEKCISQG
jgi:hypothetical protein